MRIAVDSHGLHGGGRGALGNIDRRAPRSQPLARCGSKIVAGLPDLIHEDAEKRQAEVVRATASDARVAGHAVVLLASSCSGLHGQSQLHELVRQRLVVLAGGRLRPSGIGIEVPHHISTDGRVEAAELRDELAVLPPATVPPPRVHRRTASGHR